MASKIGSVSVFSDIDDGGNVILDPTFSECDAAIALQELRQLDTRFNTNILPDLNRESGINLLFATSSTVYGRTTTKSTYDDHKMRRKAEVLKHKHNKLNQSLQKRVSSAVLF